MQYNIARGLSLVLNPLLIPVYLLLVLLNFQYFMVLALPLTYIMLLTAVVVMTTILFPLFATWLMYRLGLIREFPVRHTDDRIFPILIFAFFYYITYYLVKGIHFSAIFSFYMLALTLLLILSLIILRFRNLNLHMVGIGSITGLFTGITLNFGLNLQAEIVISILIAGITGFSQLGSSDCKPAEIYLGYALGVIVTAGTMFLL